MYDGTDVWTYTPLFNGLVFDYGRKWPCGLYEGCDMTNKV